MSGIAACAECTVPLRALISESQNGLSKRAGDEGDELPVLRLADISSGAIDESAPRAIRLTAKERAKYQLRRGDLLCIRVNGSKGLVGRMVPFTSTHAWAYCDHFIRLRPDPAKVDFRYLAYFLNSGTVRRVLELGMVSSAGQHTVSQGTVLELAVPLLPMCRQLAIVAEIEKQFSRLDEAVANLQRVKANLKRYKAAVLSDAVVGDLAGESNRWEEAVLGDVAASVRNGYSQKPDAEYGTPILRISAVRPLDLNTADVRFMSGLPSDYEPFTLAADDVLFTRYNGSRDYVGVCAKVPDGVRPTVYPDKLIRVRVPTDLLLPAFLVIAASTGQARAFIESRIRTTAGQAGISGADLKALPLRLPPLAEQHRIVAEVDRRLSIVREVEAEVDANLKRAQKLRQAVLQRAFPQPIADQTFADEQLIKLDLVPGTTTLIESARVALSAEIVHQLHAHPTFGQVKHQKVFHLAEHIARLESLQVRYRRAGFGPLNMDVIKANERALERLSWYAERPRPGSDGHCYVQLSNAGGHTEYLKCFTGDQLKSIRGLAALMRGWKTEECEMFSTAYAAWNDLIIMRRAATPDAILREVLELWDAKKKRFSRQQWLGTIDTIGRQGFAPTGFGQLTRSPYDGVTLDLFDSK